MLNQYVNCVVPMGDMGEITLCIALGIPLKVTCDQVVEAVPARNHV